MVTHVYRSAAQRSEPPLERLQPALLKGLWWRRLQLIPASVHELDQHQVKNLTDKQVLWTLGAPLLVLAAWHALPSSSFRSI